MLIPAGCTVLICGLSSRPDLNGQLGTVLSHDPVKARYGVQLGAQKLSLRAECIAPHEPDSSEDDQCSSDASDAEMPDNSMSLQQRIQALQALVTQNEVTLAEHSDGKHVQLLDAQNDEWEYGGVRVVLGTERHAAQPELVKQIADMINAAYYEANKPFLHPSQTTFERVDCGEVHRPRTPHIGRLTPPRCRCMGGCRWAPQVHWTPTECCCWRT